jgi:flagellar assembly protein FliH
VEVTRSLPNIIKAYVVTYDDSKKKMIDSQQKQNKKIPRQLTAVATSDQADASFVEGIDASLVEKLSPHDEMKKSDEIVENAKTQAQHILEQAKAEAEANKEEVYAAARKQGYEDGRKHSDQEAVKQNAAYEDKVLALEKKYDNMAAEMEPEIAELIASLVEKITGIVVDDQKEVIRYLVERALKKYDKSNEYTIRVSPGEYGYLLTQQEYLHDFVGREVILHVEEDSLLHANQCIIETDLRVINCSLDEQLKNLTTDLKLLGHMVRTEGR